MRTIHLTLAGVLFPLMVAGGALANDNQPRDRFSEQVAGSFVIAAYLGDESDPPVQAMATLSAGGGVVATDTDDFGYEILQDFHGPKHGSWQRTGDRELTLSIYEFGYSVTGPKGYTPIVVYKLTFVVQFDDKSLSGGSGTVTYKAHLLPALDSTADPLDLESGTLVAIGGGDVEFARLPL
jgi:hypothetical protein